VFWSVLAALVGFGLFHVKYQVQALEDRLAQLNRSIVHEQEQIHVLHAEWTYLDRPERIEELSKKFLDLAPPKPDQIGSIAQLPMRPAEESSPSDPSVPTSARHPDAAAPVAEDYPSLATTPVAAHPTREKRPATPALPGDGR
jgi:cell division protein FtsL